MMEALSPKEKQSQKIAEVSFEDTHFMMQKPFVITVYVFKILFETVNIIQWSFLFFLRDMETLKREFFVGGA